MHILLTTDGAGGVSTFTAELARGLAERGHRVSRVVLGSPGPNLGPDLGPIYHLPGRLEWMDGAAADVAAHRHRLSQMSADLGVDLIHSNHFAAALGGADGRPRLLTVHSDVLSWRRTVLGADVPTAGSLDWYRDLVTEALASAALVTAPSQATLDDLRLSYGLERPAQVVYNGRSAGDFVPPRHKQALIAGVGRLWDAGKNPQLLCRTDLPWPAVLAGPSQHPVSGGHWHPPAVDGRPARRRVRLLGAMPPAGIRHLLRRAAIFVGTSRYEPFGLAPLEAALSGCALVLNDIPSYREIWAGSAAYFARDSGDALARVLQRLAGDDRSRAELAANGLHRARTRYSAAAMTDAYVALYRRLVSRSRAGAPAP